MMRKQSSKNESMVHEPKIEKLWIVEYAQIRRHSRVLYLPLDPLTVRLNKLKKGDTIKYHLVELRRAPPEDEPILEKGELQ
jgi:hypothetical protein